MFDAWAGRACAVTRLVQQPLMDRLLMLSSFFMFHVDRITCKILNCVSLMR